MHKRDKHKKGKKCHFEERKGNTLLEDIPAESELKNILKKKHKSYGDP